MNNAGRRQRIPGSPAAGEPPNVDFLRLYHALIKRLWVAALVFAIVVTGVAI